MRTCLVAFVAMLMISCNPAPDPVQRIDELFSSLYPDPAAPGTAVLLMQGDSILFEKCYGLADLETGEPITPQTNFCLASISKQFAATAILQLAERGELSLDDPLSRFFPEFKAGFYDSITLRHILSHTSGIPDARPRDDHDFVYYSTDVESCHYMIDLDRLNFEPGTQYEYVNPTYQLIYQIVERVTGVPFEEYMHRNIFGPAGMDSTLYFEAGRYIPSMSHGYTFDESAGGYVECDYGETAFYASKADGCLYSSLHDFALWEKALRGNSIIGEELKREAWTPHVMIPEDAAYGYNVDTGYGYGWFIQRTPGRSDCIYHLGDNGGYLNYAGRIPNKGILLVFLANCDRIDRIATADAVYDILREAGII